MPTIPYLATAMRNLLTKTATQAGRQVGFRDGKFSAATLLQTLIFGWLAKPQASRSNLKQTAATRQVQVTPQAVHGRLTHTTANLLKRVLDQALQQVVAAEPAQQELLARFNGVYLLDSTVINLPPELTDQWRGCGGSYEQSDSALKVAVSFDYLTGSLHSVELCAARTHDAATSSQSEVLPVGALRVADLGYFSLKQWAALAASGVYFLSRYKARTLVYDQSGQPLVLEQWLAAQNQAEVEAEVYLGAEQLPVRLLARQVPESIAAQRAALTAHKAKRKQRKASEQRLTLSRWLIYVTNTPHELMSLAEALVLAAMRWQIELLFKLWKAHNEVDEWRSKKPEAILCEVYAKLLGIMIQHWLLLAGCWSCPERSLVIAAQVVQQHAQHLASSLDDVRRLGRAIAIVVAAMQGSHMNKSKQEPRLHQLLINPALASFT